jgi:hypothetical protein
MVLKDESGVDGENFAVYVKLDAVASAHVAFASQVGDEVILNPADGYEGGGVVGDPVLGVDRPLEDTAIFGDIVLRIRHNADPLAAVKVSVPNV